MRHELAEAVFLNGDGGYGCEDRVGDMVYNCRIKGPYISSTQICFLCYNTKI